jgi:hypothetical protein
MRNRPFTNIGDDFHVLVRVQFKAGACFNDVIIDHSQGTETHTRGVVVRGKAEMVPCIEPAMVGVAEFFVWDMVKHYLSPVEV